MSKLDVRRECELIYDGKEAEKDILANTATVPLQKVKAFGDGSADEWHNMLIFGDNLEVLKNLLIMKEADKLKSADGTPGVKLIYIDPPFASNQKIRTQEGQEAYLDRLVGAKFLEFLRKRLIFLRELLSDDGNIYLHLDSKQSHYMKVLMDEIFGEKNFRNAIIVKRKHTNIQLRFHMIRSLTRKYDVLLFYSKKPSTRFKRPKIYFDKIRAGSWFPLLHSGYRPTMRYEVFGMIPRRQDQRWAWSKERTIRAIKNYEHYIERYAKSLSIDDYYMHILETTGQKLDFARLSLTGNPEYYIPPIDHRILGDVWMDFLAYENKAHYPTEKKEELLNRIIYNFSKPGDLVLDCFAGSGTTLAVAEKLGRRWIGIDCGKLAIHTIQKRLLNIAESKNLKNPKRKYGKVCKPFIFYSAGLDFDAEGVNIHNG